MVYFTLSTCIRVGWVMTRLISPPPPEKFLTKKDTSGAFLDTPGMTNTCILDAPKSCVAPEPAFWRAEPSQAFTLARQAELSRFENEPQ